MRKQLLNALAEIPDTPVLFSPEDSARQPAPPSKEILNLVHDSDLWITERLLVIFFENPEFLNCFRNDFLSPQKQNSEMIYRLDIKSRLQSDPSGPNFSGYLLNIQPGMTSGNVVPTVAPIRKSGLPQCSRCGFTGVDLQALKDINQDAPGVGDQRPASIRDMENHIAFEIDRLIGIGKFDSILLKLATTTIALKGNLNSYSFKFVGVYGPASTPIHTTILSIINLRPRVLYPINGKMKSFWSQWEACEAMGRDKNAATMGTRSQPVCPQCHGLGFDGAALLRSI
jgi:hypothetical protein